MRNTERLAGHFLLGKKTARKTSVDFPVGADFHVGKNVRRTKRARPGGNVCGEQTKGARPVGIFGEKGRMYQANGVKKKRSAVKMHSDVGGLIMKCIIALMLSAIAIANETGLGRIHPGLGIAVCAVIFWGAVKLIYASI